MLLISVLDPSLLFDFSTPVKALPNWILLDLSFSLIGPDGGSLILYYSRDCFNYSLAFVTVFKFF